MRFSGISLRAVFVAFVCAATTLSAGPLVISDVFTRYKTTGDFKSIREFFTGKESKPDVLERTVPTVRDGMYFIIDLDWLKKSDLLLGTQIEIDYIRSDDAQPRKAVFYLYETRSTLPEMQFGLTGPDWPGKNVSVSAYKVTIRDPLGEILAEKSSFLWGLTDPERLQLIAQGRAQELPDGKQSPKSDLKRPPAPEPELVVVAAPEAAAVAKPTLSPERLAAIRASAERGEARGMLAMGLLYLKGIGVEEDPSKGLEYLRKAADEGSVSANYDLGLVYLRGDGTAQNFTQAEHYLTKAADAGSARAQYNLGYLYSYSGHAQGDGARAAHWYERSARQGFPPAQYNLAFLLTRGDGSLKVDLPMAYYWALIAEKSGNPSAQKLVKKLKTMVDKSQRGAIESSADDFLPKKETAATAAAAADEKPAATQAQADTSAAAQAPTVNAPVQSSATPAAPTPTQP